MEERAFLSRSERRSAPFSSARIIAICLSSLLSCGLAVALLFCGPTLVAAEEGLVYRVNYDLAAPAIVHISVNFPIPGDAPLTLIMPRAVPGGYAQRPYDPFVANVKAYSAANAPVEVRREPLGPRWKIGKIGERITRVEYDVDVARMEREIFAASDSSKIRDGYVGLLGYSIFAFFDGWENQPLRLEVTAPASWPVFSTLTPKVPAERTALTARAENYYALADSQIVMGPKLQLRQIDGGVPLFLSVYAECDEDLSQEGALAREALDKVTAYFGKTPFSNYTVGLELLRPVSPRHEYGFSMEHLNSGTFYFSTDQAITAKSDERERDTHRFNYAHHIAHSWIPKRAYGVGYLPFTWEMTPIIDTIWFNEGFARYVAIEALAEALPEPQAERYRTQKLQALRGILDAAPPVIQRMSLTDLSREGSFLYGEDFRIGQNLFSRGALMAAEMDDRIRAQTNGQKSLRDALRHLMEWSDRNRRAFRTEELPAIFREASGVDTALILDRWMQPRCTDPPLSDRVLKQGSAGKHLWRSPMATSVPEKYADLLGKKTFATLGTLMPDGSPQVTPVWFDYDGKHVRVNSALGRVKDKNIRRDPRVSLSIPDPENPYRYLEIRGKVVDITQNGADDHINSLSQKYLGNPVYPFRQPGEVRVLYKIEPVKFSSLG